MALSFSFFKEIDPIVHLAIDNSRQLLYVLTEKGSIEAWDMGRDCNTMRRIAKITQNDIVQSASNIVKYVSQRLEMRTTSNIILLFFFHTEQLTLQFSRPLNLYVLFP